MILRQYSTLWYWSIHILCIVDTPYSRKLICLSRVTQRMLDNGWFQNPKKKPFVPLKDRKGTKMPLNLFKLGQKLIFLILFTYGRSNLRDYPHIHSMHQAETNVHWKILSPTSYRTNYKTSIYLFTTSRKYNKTQPYHAEFQNMHTMCWCILTP